jgi:hypothetical protein
VNHEPLATDAAAETSVDLEAVLTEALMDEYKAEATYRAVMVDHGEVRPFSNIVGAEGRHAAALIALFEQRGLSTPANPWDDASASVVHYSTVKEACIASAAAEIDNIAIYDRLLAATLPADVEQFFRALQDASRLRHLPAFERCSR